MGAQLCSSICSGTDDNTEQQITVESKQNNDQQQLLQNSNLVKIKNKPQIIKPVSVEQKEIHKTQSMVRLFEKQRSERKLKIEDHADDKGMMLYLLYVKKKEEEQMKKSFHKQKADPLSLATRWQTFDKPDPFKCVYDKWKLYNINDKSKIVDQVWYFVLENKCIANNYDILTQKNLNTMNKHWGDLSYLEKRTYLLKLCKSIGPDMNRML